MEMEAGAVVMSLSLKRGDGRDHDDSAGELLYDDGLPANADRSASTTGARPS
jgi:hypothetical protein